MGHLATANALVSTAHHTHTHTAGEYIETPYLYRTSIIYVESITMTGDHGSGELKTKKTRRA